MGDRDRGHVATHKLRESGVYSDLRFGIEG